MAGIRDLMTVDHRRCDELFAAVEQAVAEKRSAAASDAFARFRQAMLAHFDAEELTLFPAFEDRTGMRMGPTQMMRMEHAQMRELMDEALETLAGGNAAQYLGVAETLLIMMQQHNMKEENVLYPMCEQHLGGEAAPLVARLRGELAAP